MMSHRWSACAREFQMTVRVTTAPDKYEFITPTTSWQQMKIGQIPPGDFKIEADRFYVNVRLGWSYVDPRLEENRGSGRSSWF